MTFNGSQPLLSTSDEDTDMFESPNQTGSPERRLLLAVLERAILDYVGNDKREIESAKEWIFAGQEETTYSLFSFEWVCQQLDLNASEIAGTIKRMPKRGGSKIAPWYVERRGLDKHKAGQTTAAPRKFKDSKVRKVDFASGANAHPSIAGAH